MSKSMSGRTEAWFKKRTTKAGMLLGGGFLVTVVLAILSSRPTQNAPVFAVLLVVLGGLFQLGASRTFHSVGRADPGHAKAVVMRLINLGRQSESAEREVQWALECGSNREREVALGKVSVHLSYAQTELETQLDDWMQFHYEALAEIVEQQRSSWRLVSGGDRNVQ